MVLCPCNSQEWDQKPGSGCSKIIDKAHFAIKKKLGWNDSFVWFIC